MSPRSADSREIRCNIPCSLGDWLSRAAGSRTGLVWAQNREGHHAKCHFNFQWAWSSGTVAVRAVGTGRADVEFRDLATG